MSIITFKEKDGTLNVHAAGYLTKDPKSTEKVVLFGICYDSKRKKYLDCRAWANDTTGQIAACLEKHDNVVVDGIYESYTGKDGETKWQLSVDGLVPMTVPMESAHESAPAAHTQPKSDTLDVQFDDMTDDLEDGLPF